jgi:hypothetical protein
MILPSDSDSETVVAETTSKRRELRSTTARPPDPAVEAAAAGRVVDEPQQSEKAKQKKEKKKPRGPPKRHTDVIGAYSVPDFCRLHGGISEAFFWKIVADGHGPKLMKVGARTLVSVEAAAAWRRQREAAAARSQELKPTPSGRERLRDPSVESETQ